MRTYANADKETYYWEDYATSIQGIKSMYDVGKKLRQNKDGSRSMINGDGTTTYDAPGHTTITVPDWAKVIWTFQDEDGNKKINIGNKDVVASAGDLYVFEIDGIRYTATFDATGKFVRYENRHKNRYIIEHFMLPIDKAVRQGKITGVGGKDLMADETTKVELFKDPDNDGIIGYNGIMYKDVQAGQVYSFMWMGSKFNAYFDLSGKFIGYWSGVPGHAQSFKYNKYAALPPGTVTYNSMDDAAMAFAEEYGPYRAKKDEYSLYEHTKNIFYVGNGKWALGSIFTNNERSSVDATKSRLKNQWDLRATVHTHPGTGEERYEFSEGRDFRMPSSIPEEISEFWEGIKTDVWNGEPGDLDIARHFDITSYIVLANGTVRKFIPGGSKIIYGDDNSFLYRSFNYECEKEETIGYYH